MNILEIAFVAGIAIHFVLILWDVIRVCQLEKKFEELQDEKWQTQKERMRCINRSRSMNETIMREALEIANGRNTSAWIRTDDKLPESGEKVLVLKGFGVGLVTLGYRLQLVDNMSLWYCLQIPYGEYETPWVGAGAVQYWMPLPEPPKGESE